MADNEPDKIYKIGATIMRTDGHHVMTEDSYFPSKSPADAFRFLLDMHRGSLDLTKGRLEIEYSIATREEMLAHKPCRSGL